MGVVSELVTGLGGASDVLGVAYRASDDLVYVATSGPDELWSVTSGGVPSFVMPLPTIIYAIEVVVPGFGGYEDQIVGIGSDKVNGFVYAFDPVAASSTEIGMTNGELSDLVFDPSSSVLYVANHTQGEIMTMGADGSFGALAGGLTNSLDGLAVDPGVSVFASQATIDTVVSVDIGSGMQTDIANASFQDGNYVTGLLYDNAGHLLMKVASANIDYVIP